jgi:hypothetical protein
MLDFVAESYVRGHRRGATATAGERHKLFRLIERHANALLAVLGSNTTYGPLGNDTTNAVSALLLDAPANEALDYYLRGKIAAELNATEVPSEWHGLRVSVLGLRFLMHRATLAAKMIDRKTGAPRKAPSEEIHFVASLRGLFVEVTGDPRLYTINDVEGKHGGPLVDLIAAVAAKIRDNLHVVKPDPERDGGIVDRLTSLTSPGHIIWRIRQARRMGLA